MAKEGSALHVEGSTYQLHADPANCKLSNVVVVCNGLALVQGKDYKVVRREKYKKYPLWTVDFLYPVKKGDMIQFGGDATYMPADMLVNYAYEEPLP